MTVEMQSPLQHLTAFFIPVPYRHMRTCGMTCVREQEHSYYITHSDIVIEMPRNHRHLCMDYCFMGAIY